MSNSMIPYQEPPLPSTEILGGGYKGKGGYTYTEFELPPLARGMGPYASLLKKFPALVCESWKKEKPTGEQVERTLRFIQGLTAAKYGVDLGEVGEASVRADLKIAGFTALQTALLYALNKSGGQDPNLKRVVLFLFPILGQKVMKGIFENKELGFLQAQLDPYDGRKIQAAHTLLGVLPSVLDIGLAGNKIRYLVDPKNVVRRTPGYEDPHSIDTAVKGFETYRRREKGIEAAKTASGLLSGFFPNYSVAQLYTLSRTIRAMDELHRGRKD